MFEVKPLDDHDGNTSHHHLHAYQRCKSFAHLDGLGHGDTQVQSFLQLWEEEEAVDDDGDKTHVNLLAVDIHDAQAELQVDHSMDSEKNGHNDVADNAEERSSCVDPRKVVDSNAEEGSRCLIRRHERHWPWSLRRENDLASNGLNVQCGVSIVLLRWLCLRHSRPT